MSTRAQYASLQHSLYLTLFISVVGGGFFLATSLFIAKDKKNAELITKGESWEQRRSQTDKGVVTTLVC